MKHTAVRWLENVLIWDPISEEEFEHNMNCWEQAKEMEKEQIEDAHIEGQRVFDDYPHTQWTNDQAEEYYNKTFKANEK